MEYFIVLFHIVFITGGSLTAWRLSGDLDDKVSIYAFLTVSILTILASISFMAFIAGASW